MMEPCSGNHQTSHGGSMKIEPQVELQVGVQTDTAVQQRCKQSGQYSDFKPIGFRQLWRSLFYVLWLPPR